ncbi:MAG: efflux RND transporter periplasmic adaptor subunit [Nitrospira sp.]|nr:efflux RND transporter periplasmic adaptor subunit [Nitrospira sp.]MDH4371081.1 efflux RND transporter periplasmic adaptor subunit [Nitrospira sp.]MDH5349056.1 efflux RND transporter periplasmic adaptor subunit [Nitrospira sp.]MDH5498722.1 efflux RND transporter periplasmic adaptor subunit [Nitrospira sp.]MDH5726868.1 efflux RND transporter periplasmic adaptor subunit [Nitrospira sp.]
MTTDPHEPKPYGPVTEVVQGHTDAAPAHRQSESLPEQRRPVPVTPLPARSRQSLLPWLIGIVMIMVIGGGGMWYWWTSGTPPIQYKTTLVDRGPITAIVTATGTVNPVVSVQVGSQVSGKVSRLFADFNSKVTKGQILAQIDQKPFKARLSQARAAVKSAKGNLAKAKVLTTQRKREFDRMAALRERAFVPQSDVDIAETNYQEAAANIEVLQAQLDQARAALDSAELDLGYTTIYSPVDGIVVSRNVDAGQTLAAAFQTPILFVIAQDLTQMQVNANVSESDIGGVTEGKPAHFRVDAYPKEFFEGTVTQVRNAPISIQNVVTYDVMITVNNQDLKLKPGMTANVTIVTEEKENPLRVPNGALRFRMPDVPFDRKVTSVWIRDSAGRAHQVPVTTDIADSLYTEIVEGALNEGDPVIVGIESSEEDQAEKKLPPGFAPSRR